jgi:Tol biopolymer transport system component
MNDHHDEERWLEIAGLILDGKPVPWDTMPGGRPPDDASADALHVIAEVADLHRAPTVGPVHRWGTLAIQEQIGHGTFGDVYRARDAALDRDVALKLVDHSLSATAPEEGRLLARVRHSNVVTVHGAAIHDGRYGIWMEFIRGRTLAAIVREQGPLAAEDVTAIGIDVCRALGAVHASGLLHGDIKPQNVMREEGGRIVVMDFGTGRVAQDGARGDRLAGTPLYLAPEVLRGAAPDVRADVYGAGVLLYYLVTGALPVEGSTLDEVRAAHASGVRTPVRSRRPEMPRPLAAIIERATAAEPSARFASAAAFERALRESSAKHARTFRTRYVALMAASVLIAAMGAGYWLSSIPPTTFWPTLRRLTWDGGLTTFPSVSRDGTLLAYASDRAGRGHLDIWIERLGGGDPIQLTTDPADDSAPDISPEGTRVAYRSDRVGASGVYVVPASGGGSAQLLVPGCRDPKYSPDGKTIACWKGDAGGAFYPKAAQIWLVSATGGMPRLFRPDFEAAAYPLWMPDSASLLFLGRKTDAQGHSLLDWWVASESTKGGEHATGALKAFQQLGLNPVSGSYWIRPEAWLNRDVLFSARRGDATDVWNIGISARGTITTPPAPMTQGTGAAERPASPVTGDRSIVFSSLDVDYQLRRVQLPLTRSASDVHPEPFLPRLSQVGSPSVSADGRLLVYSSRQPNGYRIVAVDTATETQRSMTTVESSDFVRVVLSGDGKYIVYGAPGKVGYRGPVNPDGVVQQICSNCSWPTHVNFDGSAALFESAGADERLILWSLSAGVRPLIGSPDPKGRQQFGGRFSPNGKWVAFYARAHNSDAREIIVVPNAPERKLRDDEWVSISEGQTTEREPVWSPDGRRLFFISDRDGFRCIWYRDMDPETGRPTAPAIALTHFHSTGERLAGPTASAGSIGFTATANGLVFTVAQSVGNIWGQRIAR